MSHIEIKNKAYEVKKMAVTTGKRNKKLAITITYELDNGSSDEMYAEFTNEDADKFLRMIELATQP